jgi:thiol:disulfide interchange protein
LLAASVVLGALALALGPVGTPPAEAGKGKTVTKVTAKATKPDGEGRQTVTVVLDIETPWYAYANPVGNKEFEQAQTSVEIKSKAGKLEDVKISYPPGKEKSDKDFGNFRIYPDGKVTITGQVRRAKGDTGPLDVVVKYMTCHPKGTCLPPETVKLTVE